MSLRPWIKRVLFGLAGLVALLVFGVLPYFLASQITSRRFNFRDRENAGLTPASFGLAFEDVALAAADGVQIKGWWVPAPEPRGTVVLVHGLNRSRIEMVRKVPFLHRLGWNALLFDQRAHGESGGAVRSLGYHEKNDVHAAVAWAQQRSPQPVAVWGISLGAAAATLAAAEDGRVAALVSDSSFRSLRDTARHHLRLFRGFRWYLRVVPAWPLSDEVVFWVGRKAGFDPDALDVRAAAPRLSGRPVLFVCNTGDQRMPPEIALELKEAAGPRARVLVVPGSGHGHAWRDGTAAYEHAVQQLLEEAGGGPVRMAAR
ncbi:MAG TPA: alpha/beta fold hydrolase [Vicinamibacteria bacterium]|nr:alpha/beta fold hydrolase [Vicinamibacteria bacterium]